MGSLFVVLLSIVSAPANGEGSASWSAPARPVGEKEGLFSYRFEKGDLCYSDILTLRDGSQRLGKAMEWANQVLLCEADGNVVAFPVGKVEQFEFRRAGRHKNRPALPDLTVAYVERLPRDPSWHGHVINRDGMEVLDLDVTETAWRPAVGSIVTFRTHVLNAGGTESARAPFRVLIDGAELTAGEIPPLDAGKEHVVEVSWPWQDGRHTLRIELDPEGTTPEIVRWNNTFVESIDAQPVAVVVSSDRYEAFKSTANIVDSFCFEDWLQYQLRVLNALFAASVYPSTPDGIQERVRCDRIIVVSTRQEGSAEDALQATLRRGSSPDGLAEYAALWKLGPLYEEEYPAYDALKVDWDGLQHLGRELGLVDLSATDTTIQQCMVRDRNGRYVQRRHVFPWRRSMMYTAGGFLFDERSAAALQRNKGRPRGFHGDYLYQLPDKIRVEVRSNAGTPLPGTQVDVYQLMSEGEHAGAVAGLGGTDPLFSVQSGPDGRVSLLDRPAPSHTTPAGYELRPNPFGKISVDGSNGLLLLRLQHGASEEFHFLRLFDCNVAYLRGHTSDYVHRLSTHFGAAAAPNPPPYAAVIMEDRSSDEPPAQVIWKLPPDSAPRTIQEFRVYRRTSFGGEDAKPWTLVNVVREQKGRWNLRVDGDYFEEFRYDGPYSLDTFYAVSAVDRQGRESSLSASAYIAYDKKSYKLAMDVEAAYVTLTGDGPCQMIRWDGVAGSQPFGLRTRRFEGYTPSFGGVAMMPDGRLVVSDPRNHVLAFYDRGDLVALLPQRAWWPGFASDEQGEFDLPADVAADDVGNLYVADRNNDRVQVLDAQGRFLELLDGDFLFEGPHAVGYANGHLCVTDKNGTRCRVYDVQSPDHRLVGELSALVGADRGLVSSTGNVYISGQDESSGTSGILVYRPEEQSLVFDRVETSGTMGKYHRSRGLYQYRGGAANLGYFVNQFPFDVRRCDLK